MRVVIPAIERDGGWTDLRLLVHSLQAYANHVPVTIAWKGESSPEAWLTLRPDTLSLVPQDSAAAHFGDACRGLIAVTEGEDLLFLNDDCVATPGMVEMLEEDLRVLEEARVQGVGLVGLRSNFVAGLQNIRRPADSPRFENGIRFASETKILATDRVFGVAFYVPRAALMAVADDWTRMHWWGDALLSWDLAQIGFSHFISRAYVHHHGSRSGGSEEWPRWDAEAKAWIREHRPEVARAWKF
jgi:hypothetical protein